MILALSPTQRTALRVIEDEVGHVFDHSKANIEILRQRMGKRNRQSVVEMLFSLRGKGYLQSVGPSTKRPERWHVIVTEGGV